MNVNQTLLRLVKDVNEIKAALRQVTTNLPLYDIANENTPAAISTDQNNYVPGNYDILRINATANITITGFAGGVKGRFLEILNVGTGRITYVDGSTSSLPANRFNLPYDNNVTQLPDARVRFYYDSTQERWTLSDAPNIQGPFGKVAILRHDVSGNVIHTLTAGVVTVVKPNTVVTDAWNYWNSSLGRFVVPTGESGLYALTINMYWFSNTFDDWAGVAYISLNGTIGSGGIALLTKLNLFNDKTGLTTADINGTIQMQMSAGDWLEVNVLAASGTRDILTHSSSVPVFVFSKIG